MPIQDPKNYTVMCQGANMIFGAVSGWFGWTCAPVEQRCEDCACICARCTTITPDEIALEYQRVQENV